VGNANTTYYVIANQSASEWEVGIGTYTASGTLLSRDTVLASSNGGSLVNFSIGTKDVFVDYPAGRAVYEDAAGNVDGYPITGGTINNTVIGGTTPAAGTFTTLTATGQTSLGGVAGAEGLRVVTTASAINFAQVSGAVSGGSPYIGSVGGGTNINMDVFAKGTGSIRLNTGTNSVVQALISHTASAVNYVQVTGAATTKAVIQSSQGSDSNISFVTQTKGTGAIDLAAGSSGVNISNGGTVTALTITANGSAYTSVPTVALSAPTTAGGVQATASITMRNSGTPIIVSGGTGYTAGDTITCIGGTFSNAIIVTVSTVSSGVITAISVTNQGSYTVLPTNPVSVSGGTGSGATFNLNFVVSTIAITNAGSGYVEQPTVTFSGGGGSGAAAYATVGSGTVVKSLGSTLSLSTAGGEQFRVNDSGTSAVNYWQATGAATSSFVNLLATGSDTNVTGALIAKGTGGLYFSTNGASSNNQLRVTHTASAVNYVQVTGAATGAIPTISAQGSDANPSLGFTTKGTGSLVFFTNSSAQRQFRVSHTASAVNYLDATGSAAGSAPVLSVVGNDTNIDLTLTPKGTGNVRFGTYTGTILTPTGYVEIKDSGGTVRRLLVG
jgi:hypothetical protein